jgi:hypothetical protein
MGELTSDIVAETVPRDGTLASMAFGQQSGPPASHKQIELLRSLLQAAGHDDFRTARHVFGLTQRQAGGKFTTGEASELIDRLSADESSDQPTEVAPDLPPVAARAVPKRAAPPRRNAIDSQRALVRDMPAEVLADELQRRGWIAMPPP